MYRARIERLEKRQMFAADNLSDVVAAYVLGNCPNWLMDPNPPPIVSEGPSSLAGEPHLEDITMAIISPEFNKDHAAAAALAGGQEGEEITYGAVDGAIGEQLGNAAVGRGLILPYFEQDNLYKMAGFSDGSTNTIMFAEVTSGIPGSCGLHIEHTGGEANGIIAVLIGLAADPSDPSDAERSTASIDTWEHANMDRQGPATNGIIAVLIGLMVDPSDPSGNTVSAASSQSPVGADKLFSSFANPTLDDEALVATTYDRGGVASQIPHDMEFETWANASKFDRGPQANSFYDLLISSYLERAKSDPAARTDARTLSIASDGVFSDTLSILHEDNEFTIPRMITAAGFAKAN